MRRRDFLRAALAVPFVGGGSRLTSAAAPSGTSLFLVTADQDSSILAVDVTSGGVRRRIPTAPSPRGIDTVAGTRSAIATHTTRGVVSIIDVPSLTVRATLEAIRGPRYSVSLPNGSLAYISDSMGGMLHVVDVVRGQIIGAVDLGAPGRHLSMAPAGDQIWVALGNASPTVAIVGLADPRRPKVLKHVLTPHRAHDVAFSADGSEVWISSGSKSLVAVFNAQTGRQLALLDADRPPQHFMMLPGAAWVTSGESGTLRIHDLVSRRVRRVVSIPAGSYNVTASSGLVATPSLDLGTLTTIGRHSGTVTRSTRLAAATHDVCFIGAQSRS